MPRKEIAANTKMPAKTLCALRKSIAHWKRMRKGTQKVNESPDGECCPLCKLFQSQSMSNCRQCPVFKRTRMPGCRGTPWYGARFNFIMRNQGSLFQEAWENTADAEIAFLKSLLPVKKKVKKVKKVKR